MGKGKPVSGIQLERSKGDQHRRRRRRRRRVKGRGSGRGRIITVKEVKPLGLTKQDLLSNKTKYQVQETFFRVICQGFKGDLNVNISVVFGCLTGVED